MKIELIEYHDEPIQWTHPIMEYLNPDVADRVRQVYGIAKVKGESRTFQIKYDPEKIKSDQIKKIIIRSLSRSEIRRKLIRLFWFLVACGLGYAIVHWLIFIAME